MVLLAVAMLLRMMRVDVPSRWRLGGGLLGVRRSADLGVAFFCLTDGDPAARVGVAESALVEAALVALEGPADQSLVLEGVAAVAVA